jgi:hemoglobin
METSRQETATLYRRLGGENGVHELVDDIVAAHMENPTIRVRFLPYAEEPERLEELKNHLCMFLAQGSGGPAEYNGRSMPEAHRGMNITEAEYMAAMDDIMQVLRQHDIDERSRKDVLAIAYSLKSDIMRK